LPDWTIKANSINIFAYDGTNMVNHYHQMSWYSMLTINLNW
jgi:translation elongation factor EF-1alpha